MPTEVSLMEMLDARERRVQRQRVLLEQYHRPLICFTMNICGPVKDSPLIRRGFARGQQLLWQQFFRAGLSPLHQESCCSSRRVHTVAQLQEKTAAILTDTLTALDAAAASLYPYFEACARAGQASADRPAPETFAALRPLGCEAEGEMLDATGGVNTHKGAIFSIGIACAALGRLERSLWGDPARVLQEIAAMTAGLTERDFAGVTVENAVTAGQKLYLQYGITGVRGQVEAGLPAVLCCQQ